MKSSCLCEIIEASFRNMLTFLIFADISARLKLLIKFELDSVHRFSSGHVNQPSHLALSVKLSELDIWIKITNHKLTKHSLHSTCQSSVSFRNC